MSTVSPSPIRNSDSSNLRQTSVHPGGWRNVVIQPGAVFEGYKIGPPLGRGGMGVVYSAWDVANDRPAAVKVLGGPIGSPKLFARFCREAETVARLNWPGIVELYQVGQTPEACYLAMQLVTGINLRDWITRVPHFLANGFDSAPPTAAAAGAPVRTIKFDNIPVDLSELGERLDALLAPDRTAIEDRRYVRRVADMLRDLTAALAHAHAAGVTHRDLKPENVMIQPDGRVVVIDFGLARSFADTTITTHSALIGTPLYMAPEQLQGRPAGPPADVYAIGLIGYELLSLTLPFQARTIEGLLGEVLRKPVPPLAARNGAVPADLANVLHRAMAKDPADRYPSAAELLADLDRHLAGRRVTARVYRYLFDAREALTARPRRVAGAAYANVALSGFLLICSAFAATEGRPSAVEYAAFAVLYFLASWTMSGGVHLPRVGGWAGAAASIGLGATALLGPGPRTPATGPLITAIALALLAIGAFTTFAMGSGRTRSWLRQNRDRRRAFDREGRPAGR